MNLRIGSNLARRKGQTASLYNQKNLQSIFCMYIFVVGWMHDNYITKMLVIFKTRNGITVLMSYSCKYNNLTSHADGVSNSFAVGTQTH